MNGVCANISNNYFNPCLIALKKHLQPLVAKVTQFIKDNKDYLLGAFIAGTGTYVGLKTKSIWIAATCSSLAFLIFKKFIEGYLMRLFRPTELERVTTMYYFDVFTQTYGDESNGPKIPIRITTTQKIPLETLNSIIKLFGNQAALFSVEHKSRDTEINYCNNYEEHASTCAQEPGQACKRHLTQEEMDECKIMRNNLDPFIMHNRLGYEASASGLNINRGDIDLMRRVLKCVRHGINTHIPMQILSQNLKESNKSTNS